jgi:2-oxo-4-hydroxy-4-carboxy-5-ureidoimidazoline decarboxylase
MSGQSIEPSPEQLRTALGVERWVADVTAAAPFADLDALLEVAAVAATPLVVAEIEEALAHHPRIGERARGSSASAEHSRREQASPDADDASLGERLAAGNAAYEERFGRIFLIRAIGRSRAEILAELERRMTLDDHEELVTVGEQLREIALLRLTATFA